MTKQEILKGIENANRSKERNSMGCNESWYNPFFALKETFGAERLSTMSEKELNDLMELADAMSDAFY